MAGCLKEYVECQIEAILKTVDRNTLTDPELFRREVLVWIEKNAAEFRTTWERQHTMPN